MEQKAILLNLVVGSKNDQLLQHMSAVVLNVPELIRCYKWKRNITDWLSS